MSAYLPSCRFVCLCVCVLASVQEEGCRRLISRPQESKAASVSGVTANQLSVVNHLPAHTHTHVPNLKKRD